MVKLWQTLSGQMGLKRREGSKKLPSCVFVTSSVARQNAIALGALCVLSAVRIVCGRLFLFCKSVFQAADGDHIYSVMAAIRIIACSGQNHQEGRRFHLIGIYFCLH